MVWKISDLIIDTKSRSTATTTTTTTTATTASTRIHNYDYFFNRFSNPFIGFKNINIFAYWKNWTIDRIIRMEKVYVFMQNYKTLPRIEYQTLVNYLRTLIHKLETPRNCFSFIQFLIDSNQYIFLARKCTFLKVQLKNAIETDRQISHQIKKVKWFWFRFKESHFHFLNHSYFWERQNQTMLQRWLKTKP